MFILKRTTSQSIEINDCLGVSYVIILKESNNVEFEKMAKIMKWNDADIAKDIYGFITYNNGADIMPLYLKSHYLIMVSDGKTVSSWQVVENSSRH